ncbi:MAG: RNA polymerase sigma factor [Candidatus Limnocylindrales bacterium]
MTNGSPWERPEPPTMESTQSGSPPGGSTSWRPAIDTAATRRTAREDSDDRAIVDTILAGDRDAFRRLVDRESAAVIRACHRILGDLAEAEDVAQDAFVIAYRSLSTWRGEGPFGAWLARIAVRLALRQVKQRRAVTWVRPSEGVDPEERLRALPAGNASDPERVAIQEERSHDLRRAVAGLDEPYREIVALRFFAERSLDEIASITSRPLGTVKTQLHRGLLRLRDRVGEGADR